MTRAQLRALVKTGSMRNDPVVGPYLTVAAALYQLVDDGAAFYLTDTEIKFSMPGVCDWCQIPLPPVDFWANFFIDIITPNLVDDD